MSVIEFKSVVKKFGDLQALNGLNLNIESGEIYALLGHNGAGKTTSLRIILGLLKPDSGSVKIFDKDILKFEDEVRANIGILSESTGLYDNLTVYDNLKLYGQIYRMPIKKMDDRINYLLEYYDIHDKKFMTVGKFSLGMKKKVALIRAIFHEPKLILLDEPSNGLDPVSLDKLHEQLKLMKSDSTIVLTTHNLDEVEKICDKITIIDHGKDIYTKKIMDEQVTTNIKYKTTLTDEQLKNILLNVVGDNFEIDNDFIKITLV